MPRLLSGIQPTGNITLGNYLGAIKNFVKLQDELPEHEFFIFIADLHAITVFQDREKLRKNIKSLAALYLACGLRSDRVNLFIQSEVPMHSQLAYIMECNGMLGELERMTQYKDKKVKQVNGVSVGLLTYPCLMAADILLYDADIVPVGQDQTQHLELTRDLATRFNNRYGDTFVIPQGYKAKTGAKIMSLADPSKKMSKSDENPKAYISLLDDINVIKNKIKSAVTDLDATVKYDPENKPGISNLLTIYQAITGMEMRDIEEMFKDSNYQTFKEKVAEVVIGEIAPIQQKYNEYLNSKELDEILNNGRDAALRVGFKKISKVYQKIGLGRKIK